MRNKTSSHSGPLVPHLLQFVLLSHLAIAIACVEVALHAGGEIGTSRPNIMINVRCRSGTEVKSSIPICVQHELSRRSRKELLFPLRSVQEEPTLNSLSQGARSQRTNLSDSRNVGSSATSSLSCFNHGPKSDSRALSRISNMHASRPQGRRPAAKKIISQSVLHSSSDDSSSCRRDAHHSSLPKEALGLSTQEVSPSGSVSRKDSREFYPTNHSVSRKNFDRSSARKGRQLNSASRRQGQRRKTPEIGLGRRFPEASLRSQQDVEHDKSHQLLEDGEFIPVDVDRHNISISNSGEVWNAPPMESGPLITITVAQSVDADFSTIQKAVDSVPEHNTQRVVIRIHAGTYSEKILVPWKKPFITFHGDEHGGTVVSWNATASSCDDDCAETKYETKFARIDFNASSALYGTMRSASVTILSDGFVAQHMVFENSAPPPEPGAVGAQAVAFLIGGDRAAFYYCSFLGAQDTLYDYSGRHYYMNCYIQGSIDFIFGNGRSLFEGCHLHSIATSFGAIAAHQRLSPVDNTGFSFDRCYVTGSGTLYLGRAWSPYARIVFARTYLDNIISAEGWSDFGDPQRRSTTFFGQYQLTGPGANLSHRAPWAKLLTDDDVLPYLGLNFVNGRQWLGTSWPNGTGLWPNVTAKWPNGTNT